MRHSVTQVQLQPSEPFQGNQLFETALSQNAKNVLSMCLLSYCRPRDSASVYRFLS